MRFHDLTVSRVTPEAAGAVAITLAVPAELRSQFDFQPGQFLTVRADIQGSDVRRSYSISSARSQLQRGELELGIRPVEGGVFSNWAATQLKAGDTLRVMPPDGRFTVQKQRAIHRVGFAAGSGITPMMSMTMWAWDSGEMPDIAFVHAARKPADIIFKRRLEQFASRVPGLQLRFTVEEVDPFEVWSGFRGRLNQIMLGLMAPDYLEREVFCCGPEPFMRSVREMLAALGYDMARYHEESFAAPAFEEVPVTAEPPQADSEVHFTASGVTAACDGTETVLAVAKRAGLSIPSSCNFGLCGTCKVQKTAGEVTMVHNGGISDEEIAEVANLSSNSFCRYFKNRTRKHFSHFLNEIRVEYACKLIKENQFQVTQVCYEAGFNNFPNFNNAFKKITGKTPLQYSKEFI